MLEKLAQVLLRVCVRPGPHARPDSDHKSRERREEIKSLPRENVGKRLGKRAWKEVLHQRAGKRKKTSPPIQKTQGQRR